MNAPKEAGQSILGLPDNELKQTLQQSTATLAAVAATAGEVQDAVVEVRAFLRKLDAGLVAFAAAWGRTT